MRKNINNMNKGKWLVKMVLLGITVLLLVGLVTMALWNWLVPELFSGPEITFWKAVGLLALARILFGGWGGRHCNCGRSSWKHQFRETFSSMSPEERARFKEKMREKWCARETPSGNANV